MANFNKNTSVEMHHYYYLRIINIKYYSDAVQYEDDAPICVMLFQYWGG